MKKDLLLGAGLIFLAVLCAVDLRAVKEPDIIQNQVGVTHFPSLMVIILGLLGAVLMISSLVKRKAAGGAGKPKSVREGFRSRYAVPGLMFMILTVYILLTPVIGFYVMSAVFFCRPRTPAGRVRQEERDFRRDRIRLYGPVRLLRFSR